MRRVTTTGNISASRMQVTNIIGRKFGRRGVQTPRRHQHGGCRKGCLDCQSRSVRRHSFQSFLRGGGPIRLRRLHHGKEACKQGQRFGVGTKVETGRIAGWRQGGRFTDCIH